MTLPEDFIFSQSSLQDYLDCPRRFELRYIERRRWPGPETDDLLAFEMLSEQGAAFHHLVHQHLVGIPEAILLPRIEDAAVRRWFGQYLKSGLTGVPMERWPEYALIVPLGEYQLLARFDLVAVEPGGMALVVDWKTAAHLPRRDWLAQRLQTVVYRYVLVAGGDHLNGGQPIEPVQVRLMYWYAALDGATREYAYDSVTYSVDAQYLLALVEEISQRDVFPLTNDERHCRFCVYRSLCDRGVNGGTLSLYESNFEIADIHDIGEVTDSTDEADFNFDVEAVFGEADPDGFWASDATDQIGEVAY